MQFQPDKKALFEFMVKGADVFHPPIIEVKTPPITDISTIITMMGVRAIPSLLLKNSVNFFSDFVVIILTFSNKVANNYSL